MGEGRVGTDRALGPPGRSDDSGGRLRRANVDQTARLEGEGGGTRRQAATRRGWRGLAGRRTSLQGLRATSTHSSPLSATRAFRSS